MGGSEVDGSVEERTTPLFAAWILALIVAAAALSSQPIRESDVFWHMSLGRAVLENGSRTVPEVSAVAAFTDDVVVPEWLWGVSTYALYEAGGYTILSLLVLLLAGCAAAAVVLLLRGAVPGAAPAAFVLISALVVTVVSWRMRLRPQACFLILLPLFACATRGFVRAAPAQRVRWAIGLVGLELLWAQLHGSFVLGPALFACIAGPPVLRSRSAREAGVHATVFGALLLGCLTSAHGLGIVDYILSHSGGYARLHVTDMKPLSWELANPAASPFAAAWLALWGIALLGAMVHRKLVWEHWLLAALGLLLPLFSVRFIAAGGVLVSPLALQGAVAIEGLLPRRTLSLGLALAVAALTFVASARFKEAHMGPMLRMGLEEGRYPVASAAYLARLPAGSAVLSDFRSGAPIGFWLDGRVRTFVDSRTPLYFDDVDFAVARAVWTTQGALERALMRHDVQAIVVDRNGPTCPIVPRDWTPVVVEASYTTFVRDAGGTPVTALMPCGRRYFSASFCRDGGAAAQSEIERLEAASAVAFARFARAGRLLLCEGDATGAARELPDPDRTWRYRDARARLLARILLAQGDAPGALEALRGPFEWGDYFALEVAAPALMSEQVPAADARRLLERYAAAVGEGAPPDAQALIAAVCVRQGDAECVRFWGTRAAVLGSKRALRSLRWLSENHDDARVRDDASTWLRLLANERGTPGR